METICTALAFPLHATARTMSRLSLAESKCLDCKNSRDTSSNSLTISSGVARSSERIGAGDGRDDVASVTVVAVNDGVDQGAKDSETGTANAAAVVGAKRPCP